MNVEAFPPMPDRSRTEDTCDADLVRKVLDGDKPAFTTLMRRYHGSFYRLARRIVENDSDAQDVLQRAFLKIHDKLDTLRDPSSFESWGYRIVKNMALMEVRSRNRKSEIGFGDLGPGHDDERHFEALAPNWRNRGDEAAEVGELRERMIEAIESLEPKYRSPFVLHELEGYDLSEIGDLFDLTRAGVKTRLHRARSQLQASLERYRDDELADRVG